jgi:tape measure domain-containing protein
MIASVGRLIPLLGAVVAGLGSIAAVRGVAQVGSEFEDLRDSLNTVFGSINAGQGALNRILTFAQTTPFQIEDVSRAFIQLKGAGIEPSNDMLQTFADTASTSVDQLGAFQAMVRLVSRSAAGGLGLEEINQLDDRGIPATKILTEALGVTRLELSKFGQTAEGAAQMVDLLIAGMQQRFGGAMVEKMDNLSTKASNMTIAFKELGNTIFESGLGNFLGNLADKMNELASSLARMIRLRNNAFTAQDIAGTDATPEETTEILSQRIDETIKKMGTINRRRKLAEFTTLETDLGRFIQLQGESMEASLSEQVRLLPDFTDKTETATEAMGELDQVILEAGQNLSRDFANALLEGKNVLSSFSDFSKSIVSEIIATFIRLQVVEPILKGIFPTLGTDTTGTGSAGGGRASHGRPMLVGERGPELFVPHSAGNIMNNADTKSALGGGGISVVQNISFSTGVVPTVKAEITKMLPQIADVSKAAVLEANMRGGSFRRGMR